MGGFLSFISKQYGRKAEDVATDVVAYLMQRPDTRHAVCQLFADLGYSYLKPGFSVEIRTSAESGREGGIPDIMLGYGRGENQVIQAIIENKFGAGLTKYQPCAYLNTVGDNGIVLFVAPAWRQTGIWEEIRGRCQKSGAHCVPIRAGSPGRIAKVGSKIIAVISWSRVLEALSNSCTSEVRLFVDQLRRLCDVEDTVKFENLSNEVSEKSVGSTVFSSMNLLHRIINLAHENDLFEPDKDQCWRGKSDGACGPYYFGYYGKLGTNIRAWIGFDARLWAERGESPLWIEFDDQETIEQLKGMFLYARGRFPWLNEPTQLEDGKSEDSQLVVPLPLTPKVGLDALLASAIGRIEQVHGILDSPQSEWS